MNPNTIQIQLNADKVLFSNLGSTQRILEIHIQAPSKSTQHQRPSLNLGLVLDRSGSMHGAKLEFVKQAASHVLDQLQEQDQVAVVAYDDQIQVLSHSRAMGHANRFELKRLLASIVSGSSTNLADGWLTGCREVAEAAQDGTINRAMLLTDGLANIGETNPDVLAQHALEIYKDSISTSTFGVGAGFNEHLLEAMANQGGGNFYYISTPDKIPEIFLQEFNELVGISARKVEVSLDLPTSVDWHVHGGWPNEYKNGRLHIFIGDMLDAKTQDIYLDLHIPALEKPDKLALNARILTQGEPGQISEGQAQLTFQPASQKEIDSAPVNQSLMERYGMVELADEAAEALKLERQGQREAANQRLNESINRNRPFVASQVSTRYENLSQRMRTGMDEQDRKQTHFDVYKQKRNKQKKEKE
jgi:Ca-activated chloride channel family protein